MLTWGSDSYAAYADDGFRAGAYGAALESGLDNGPMWMGASFNASGDSTFDMYESGYTGLFLMDCRALMALGQLLGRADAVDIVKARFDTVSKLVNMTACKRLFSLGCVAHTDGAVFQSWTRPRRQGGEGERQPHGSRLAGS